MTDVACDTLQKGLGLTSMEQRVKSVIRPLAPETACLHAEGEAPCSEVNWMNGGCCDWILDCNEWWFPLNNLPKLYVMFSKL
jgi:hypothetical protein